MSNVRPVHRLVWLGVIAAALTTGGCVRLFSLLDPFGLGGFGKTGSSKLVKFESPDELLGYFKAQALHRVRRNGFGRRFDIAAGGLVPTTLETTADAAGNTTGSDTPFTTTNLQEAGVDESDVFKSDGRYFYIARGQSVRIIDAADPSAMAEVGRIDLDEPVFEMYLRGDRLITLSQQYGGLGFAGDDVAIDILIYPPYYASSELVLHAIDVSDKTAPTVVETTTIDGNLATSRLTNGRLILVMTSVPDLPETIVGIETMTLDDVLPKLRAGQAVQDLVPWPNWYRPGNPDGYFTTSVVTLDADDLTQTVGSAAVLAEAGTIYSSTEALYVTDAEYDPNNAYRQSTTIHKFAYGDDGAANYVATGSVPGRLLNQFSLGEYQGDLRVATHIEPGFGGDVVFITNGVGETTDVGTPDEVVSSAPAQSLEQPQQPSNAVYVLAQNGDTLSIVGSVEGIAPGEQLFAARFMGPRAFLVTFRRIDPLFTVDLSDPTHPAIRGQLKIPGFSDYLHIWNDDYLIGVGRSVETTQFGGVVPSALQLSLFDISDLDNPSVIEQIEIGGPGSYSDVSTTHKAFAFLPERGLLAVPAHIAPPASSEGVATGGGFDGVLAFQLDPSTGFDDIGSIPLVNGPFGFRTSWARAALIGNNLYGLTQDGVSAAPLDAIDSVGTVELEE